MGKVLYRAYRPKKLAEIVGQEHITTTLKNALDKGKIAHAYLLTGPRGIGKTSIARIIAHEINQLQYSEETHLDIIEIDAASNRRIDEIRDLKEKVHLSPTSSQYKVYIIDEVHMLTKEAFNALLKTLEEPPAHVIFILATTELSKLPDTIVSRTQHFAFHPVPVDEVIKHLQHIAKAEKFDIDDQALRLIAQYGEGSFRDSISLLDQVGSSGQKVTTDLIRQILGIIDQDQLSSLLQSWSNNDSLNIIKFFQTVSISAVNPNILYKQIIKYIFDSFQTLRTPATAVRLSKLVKNLSQLQNCNFLTLEMSFLDSLDFDQMSNPNPPQSTNKVEAVVTQTVPQQKPAPEMQATIDQPAKIQTSATMPSKPKTKLEPYSSELWSEILTKVKATHNTIYSILRMAETDFQKGVLTLIFHHSFHFKRMTDVATKALIDEIILSSVKNVKAIEVSHQPAAKKKPSSIEEPEDEPQIDENSINDIAKIFGGAEVLEN